MIHWFNADDKGNKSIRSFIDQGLLNELRCPSYKEFDDHVSNLMPKIVVGDVCVLDTITSMLETTRADSKLGTDPNANLWDKRSKYFEGDKNYLNNYQYAQQVIMRRLRNMKAVGARIVVIAHEDEVVDSTNTKTIGPQVNPALVGILEGQSSDIFRMVTVPQDLSPEVTAGTRVLYLRPSNEFIAKYNAEAVIAKDGTLKYPNPPRYLLNPVMKQVFEAIESKPEWLTLYGPPGVGKTTLVASEALINYKKETK